MHTLPLWAVHISDGVLGWPWLAAGFAVIGLLALIACRAMTEDDVPRVALMAAAFFVASSIHVKIGPSSVHLLLTGLVGVVLGWRAPLAILVGVTLQALLLAHGGLTTVGVNASVEAVPALACAAVFPLMRDVRSWWAGRILVGLGSLVWGVCVLAVLGMLFMAFNAVVYSPSAGVVVQIMPADVLFNPLAVTTVLVLAVFASQRPGWSPRFAAGALTGLLGVLGTVGLTGLVLLLDGSEKWGVVVSFVWLAHLPLAVVEGLVLGVAVQYLSRVKPQLIGVRPDAITASVLLLLSASQALAHGLETNYKIDRAKRSVVVTVFFETGDAPKRGDVKVYDPAGKLVAEGKTDDEGEFRFTYAEEATFRVEARAEGGHAATLTIPVGSTEGAPRESRWNGLAAGVALLLALAALAQSWLNARRLRRIEQRLPPA